MGVVGEVEEVDVEEGEEEMVGMEGGKRGVKKFICFDGWTTYLK